MAFDIVGARKAGYSDAEIADYLGKEQGFDTASAVKAGYSPLEVINHLTLQTGNAGRGNVNPEAVTPVTNSRGAGFNDPRRLDTAEDKPYVSPVVDEGIMGMVGDGMNAVRDFMTGMGPKKGQSVLGPMPEAPEDLSPFTPEYKAKKAQEQADAELLPEVRARVEKQRAEEKRIKDYVTGEHDVIDPVTGDVLGRVPTIAGVDGERSNLDYAKDAFNAYLKVSPTAIRLAAQTSSLLTGLATAGNVHIGKDTADEMQKLIEFSDKTHGSKASQLEREGLSYLLQNKDSTTGELLGYLKDRPALMADMGITTVGSMFVPVAAVRMASMVSKVPLTAQTVNTIENIANSTMNAADTYDQTDGNTAQKALAAAIAYGGTYAIGKATGGGAEGMIARRMQGVSGHTEDGLLKTVAKSMGKESLQESVENVSQAVGQDLGEGNAPDWNNAGKQAALGAAVAPLVAGPAGVHEHHAAKKEAIANSPAGILASAIQSAVEGGQWDQNAINQQVVNSMRPDNGITQAVQAPSIPAALPAGPARVTPEQIGSAVMQAGSLDDAIATANELATVPVAAAPVEQTPQEQMNAALRDLEALRNEALGVPADGSNPIAAVPADSEGAGYAGRDAGASLGAGVGNAAADTGNPAGIVSGAIGQSGEHANQADDGTVKPVSIWTSTNGEGYASRKTAEAQIQRRKEAEPDLRWKVEQMPNGRFQLAGYAKPERDPAKQQGGNNLRRASFDKNPLMTFLATHGLYHEKGKADSLKSEFSPDKALMVGGYGPVFRKGGKRLDELLQHAIQDGYLPQGAEESDLYELVRRSVSGERIAPMFTDHGAEDETERRMRAQRELEEEQAAQGTAEPDIDWDYYQHEDKETEAALKALSDQDFFITDEAIPLFNDNSTMSHEAALRALGYTDQEIQDEIAQGQGSQSQNRHGSSGFDEAATGTAQGGTGEGGPQTGPAVEARSATGTDTQRVGSQLGMFDAELQEEHDAIQQRLDKRAQLARERVALVQQKMEADTSAWDKSEFAPRIRAMIDSLRGVSESADSMRAAIISGINMDAKNGRLNEETIAFREGVARRELANAAAAGKPRPVAQWTPVTAQTISHQEEAVNLLPDAIVQAAVDRTNELGPKLAAMGYKDQYEVNSASPADARELAQKLRDINSSLMMLAPIRERIAKGHKNAKPEKLDRMEDFATEVLGINTRDYPGVKSMPDSLTLTAPTREQVVEQQDRADEARKSEEAQRQAEEKKARIDDERKRIAQASVAAADTFELGGDALQNLTGQQDIFGEASGESAQEQTEKTPEEKTTAILDANNVTGKERLDILKDVKAGTHTPEEIQAAYPNKPAAERGRIGQKLESGQVVTTSSGRETTPFPQVKTGTNRKTNATLKAVDTWLMQNALDEARARGDNFNARQFEQGLKKPSQSDKDSAEEYLFGQQPAVVPSILKPLVKPVNAEQAKAKDDLMAALGDLGDLLGKNTRLNMMPEQEQKLLPILTRIFDAAFRLGYSKFKDASKYVLDTISDALGKDFAEQITLNHLQGAYITMSGSRPEAEGIMGAVAVKSKAEIENHTATNDNAAEDIEDAPSTDEHLERDSGDGAAESAVGDSVSDGQRGNDEGTQAAAGQDGSGRGGQSGDRGVLPSRSTTSGKRSDYGLSDGDTTGATAERIARSDDHQRSGNVGVDGVPHESIPAEAVSATATTPTAAIRDKLAQRAASTDVKTGDLENIKATLPTLHEGQQEDVQTAELRHAKPTGYGMLFTNGTGTGKTFLGLGVVKRFALRGKENTLVIVPDEKIMADWVASGKVLGLNITPLEDTQDAGKGIVITTYANAGANDALASRQWDLVIPDESHKLMQGKHGEATGALDNLRSITHHPDGAFNLYQMRNRADIERVKFLGEEIKATSRLMNADDTMDVMRASYQKEIDGYEAERSKLQKKLDESREAIKQEVKDMQGEKRARVLFLSATPFAYDKTIDWANGYLFDYKDGYPHTETSLAYNQPSPQQYFFMTHLGYRMRYGKLTEPEANKVDTGLMQRQFNGWLKKQGALSSRMLDVKPDYDRRFVLVESAIGTKIDEALEWLDEQARAEREANQQKGKEAPGSGKGEESMQRLRGAIFDQFDYLSRRYILEAIKAREAIPIVKKHLAMGRKVVVFHDYKKGGSINPFDLPPRGSTVPNDLNPEAAAEYLRTAQGFNQALAEFKRRFPELIGGLNALQSPIEQFSKEIPDVLLVNGDQKQKDLLQRYATFQNDSSGPKVMLVQSAKNAGWSGHDTTGVNQRVLINLGQPTAPTMAIQQEGRIYRTGQYSNAIMRYLNTGTNWERWAFATTIAERASAAENLGMGELARALKDSIITAFEESDSYPPGHEGEGTGGKERDRATNNAITEWDRAKTNYWAQQKKTSKTKAQEGTDYFATPEPIGLKMVQWLDAKGGEDTLEPSAGHGAIARWLPDMTHRTAIEPSLSLRSRLAMVMNPAEDKLIAGNFEDHHINNKYDGIVMNPPFGSGGRTAIDHLAKAATHLRDGGRIVALIPTGPAADAKFEKWFYGTEERSIKPLTDKHPILGAIYAGDTVKTRASFAPEGQVVSLREGDFRGADMVMLKVPGKSGLLGVPVDAISNIEPTGKRTKTVSPAEDLHLIASVELPGVAFERAGTNVRTRILVIEKQTDKERAPATGLHNRDLSNAEDINALFDRLEDMAMPPRQLTAAQESANAIEQQAQELQAKKEQAKADREQAKAEGKPAKAAKDKSLQPGDTVTVDGKQYPIATYVTNDGKAKYGVWLPTKAEATKYSQRTFTTSNREKNPTGGYWVDAYWLGKNGIKADAADDFDGSAHARRAVDELAPVSRNPAKTPLYEAFRQLSRFEESFQTGTSHAQDLETIAQEMTAKMEDANKGGFTAGPSTAMQKGKRVPTLALYAKGADGSHIKLLDIFDAKTDRPYVQIGNENLGTGVGGSTAYQIALAWAHNNGKVMRPDPAGLTPINRLRRTEAMISSALHFGTTEHLEPHPDQYVALLDRVKQSGTEPEDTHWETRPDIAAELQALKDQHWREGSDPNTIAENVQSLLVAANSLALLREPAIGAFVVKDGVLRARENGTDSLLLRDVPADSQAGKVKILGVHLEPGRNGVGSTTLKRFALASSVQRSIERGRLGVGRGQQAAGNRSPESIALHAIRETLGKLDTQAPEHYVGSLYARAPKGAGLSVSRVQGIVDAIRAKNPNGPKVHVVATPALLPVRSPNDVRGLYHKGEVWIVASRVSSFKDVSSVYAHEAVAHYGLRHMLGREGWRQMMNQINTAVRSGNKALASISRTIRATYLDENGDFNLNKVQESDEIAARVVEESIDPQTGEFRPGFAFMKSVFARIAQFLRSLGVEVKFTHAELQGMLVNAMRNLQTGQKMEGGGTVAVAHALLDAYTPEEIKAKQEQEEAAKKRLAQAMTYRPVPSNKPAPKADQVDMFDHQGSLFGRDAIAPVWKSALSYGVAKLNYKALPASSWNDALKSLVNKGLVKQDEIEWSGIGDWLKLQTGKVTKEQVQDYLDANGVQVHETVLGEGDWAVYDGDENQYFDTRAEAINYANVQGINVTEDTVFRATNRSGGYGSKYAQYTLPGGENYREVLLTLPSKTPQFMSYDDWWSERTKAGKNASAAQYGKDRAEFEAAQKQPEYKSNHWDQPNVIAHIRINDRTDTDGKRVLFVEEIQSDWGQDGKKRGFSNSYTKQVKPGEFNAFVDDLQSKAASKMESVGVTKETAAYTVKGLGNDVLADMVGMREQYDDLLRRQAEDRNAEFKGHDKPIPTAPFVTKTDAWLNLALKRVITMAVQEGYDKVAFVNGAQSADRYSLAKKVEALEYKRNPETGRGFLQADDHQGNTVINNQAVTDETLPDYVGKEVAERLLATEPIKGSSFESHVLTGENLEVGGEGMKTFYDQIVPNAVKKLVPKLGGELQTVAVPNSQRDEGPVMGMIVMDWMRIPKGEQSAYWRNLTEAEREQKIEAYRNRHGATVLQQQGFTITDKMRDMAGDGLPMFARKPVNVPDAIIANPIGSAKSQDDYAAAKAGDIDAAHRVASELVTPELIEKLRKQIEGQAPIVVGVAALESTGRNAIPDTAASIIADHLGLDHDESIVQSTSPKRTSMAGLDRIFSSPEFAGKVEPGRGYVLVDDTLTQGATFAALASHIEAGGGHVAAVVALTGKDYSAKITPTPETLDKLRAIHADIEPQFQAATGYGFDGLTQSEARYIANYRPIESVRNRVAAAVQEAGNSPRQGAEQAGEVDDFDAPAHARPTIVGQTHRQYTPAQLAAMRNVGFQTDEPTLKERIAAMFDRLGTKLKQGLVDQFAPVEDICKEAYGLMRLSKGASGAFESLLHGGLLKLSDGVYDFDDKNKGGVLDKLLIPLQGEHHDFFRWIAANRAERLMAAGKENLFTARDIASLKTLNHGHTDFDYELQHGPRAGTMTRNRAAIYADALKTFNVFNKNVMDMAEESGLIDPASRAVWEHEFYVPFYRVSDEENGSVRGMNVKGGVVRQEAFKTLKGGKNALNADLLENTLMNWAHLLDAAAKNRAAQASIQAAVNIGIAQAVPSGTKKSVWVMDQGERKHFVISDPYVMTAITALEYAGMKNPVMNAMSAMKHVLTMGVTASPFFKVRNLIRDSVQAIAVSGLSGNMAKNVAQGWKLTNPESDSHFRMLAGGGTIHFGTMYEGSEAKRVQALVESGVDRATIITDLGMFKALYRNVIEPSITAYNELGNRGEEINRASLYDQLRKQGLNHADASLQARDLMDFSMQGSFATIRFLTQVVPFMNARMQGLYKLGKGAKENPAKFAAVLGAVAVVSLGLLAMYRDDDDWKKRQDWDRNNFWWFKIGGKAIRIPKPFEIGAIATLAERGFERFFDKEMTNKRFMAQVMALAGDNLSMNPIPQLFKPLLDIYANVDSFTGSPIETRSMENIHSQYRYTSGTSMTARALSTGMNAVTGLVGKEALSPVQIDHMLRGYFGWLGSFVVGTADIIARPATGQPSRPAPDIWKDATGGMVSDLRDAPSRYVTDMYAQAREIEQAYGTWQMLQKQGKREEAAQFVNEHRADLKKYASLEQIKREESLINERIRMIERSAMDPDKKSELIRPLQDRKDRVARFAVQN